MKNGFTLIELLVAVLIIGILAAIALPQYQLAVMKAKFVKYLPLGKALQQAAFRYQLATGELPCKGLTGYTKDFSNLDISVPEEIEYPPRYYNCENILFGLEGINATENVPQLIIKIANGGAHAVGKKGEIFCRGVIDKKSDKVCKTFNASLRETIYGDNIYKID